MKKISFIGLGNMGLPMALNLMHKDFDILSFDISEEARLSATSKGLKVAGDVDHLFKDTDCLITMLPAGNNVEDLFINEGVLSGISSDVLVIDCSTIDPATAKKISSESRELGISMLDAPVSGGVSGAEKGTLTFIVGGLERDVKRATPVLLAMGNKIFHAGDGGSGQVAKICNNMLLAIHMCGTAETLAMGVENGLDPKILSEIMKNSSGGNWSLDTYNPYPGVMNDVPANNDYKGGFLNSLMLKDLTLARNLALDSDSMTPMGKIAKELYEEMIEQGFNDLDFSSIQKRYLE